MMSPEGRKEQWHLHISPRSKHMTPAGTQQARSEAASHVRLDRDAGARLARTVSGGRSAGGIYVDGARKSVARWREAGLAIGRRATKSPETPFAPIFRSHVPRQTVVDSDSRNRSAKRALGGRRLRGMVMPDDTT